MRRAGSTTTIGVVSYCVGVAFLLVGVYYVSREVFPPGLLRIEMVLISGSLLMTSLSAQAYVSRRLPIAATALVGTTAFGIVEVLYRMSRIHVAAEMCAQAPIGTACAVLASAKRPDAVFSSIAVIVLGISVVLIFGPPAYGRRFKWTRSAVSRP